MSCLVINKTALLTNAINAKLDHLLRVSKCPANEVIATPIAGRWPHCGNLPWYGYQYVAPRPAWRTAQTRLSEFGHFQVIFGTPDNLRFPDEPIGELMFKEFADPMDAAKFIEKYLTTGKVGRYRKMVRSNGS